MSRAATPQPAQPGQKLSHERIAMRAYEKWVQRGRPHGSAVQDWLDAEQELKTELARGAAASGSSSPQQRK